MPCHFLLFPCIANPLEMSRQFVLCLPGCNLEKRYGRSKSKRSRQRARTVLLTLWRYYEYVSKYFFLNLSVFCQICWYLNVETARLLHWRAHSVNALFLFFIPRSRTCDFFGLQFNSDGSDSKVLDAVDNLCLFPPAIRGEPREAGKAASRTRRTLRSSGLGGKKRRGAAGLSSRGLHSQAAGRFQNAPGKKGKSYVLVITSYAYTHMKLMCRLDMLTYSFHVKYLIWLWRIFRARQKLKWKKLICVFFSTFLFSVWSIKILA